MYVSLRWLLPHLSPKVIIIIFLCFSFALVYFSSLNWIRFILIIWSYDFKICDVNIGLAFDLLSIFCAFDNNNNKGVHWRDRFNLKVSFSFHAETSASPKNWKQTFFSLDIFRRGAWSLSLELLFLIRYTTYERKKVNGSRICKYKGNLNTEHASTSRHLTINWQTIEMIFIFF